MNDRVIVRPSQRRWLGTPPQYLDLFCNGRFEPKRRRPSPSCGRMPQRGDRRQPSVRRWKHAETGCHHRIGMNTWCGRIGTAPLHDYPGLYRAEIWCSDQPAPAASEHPSTRGGETLPGTTNDSISVAIWLDDLDGLGLELRQEHALAGWPSVAKRQLAWVSGRKYRAIQTSNVGRASRISQTSRARSRHIGGSDAAVGCNIWYRRSPLSSSIEAGQRPTATRCDAPHRAVGAFRYRALEDADG